MNTAAMVVILVSGMLGIFAMQSAIRNGAHVSIDHPSAWVRYSYRYMVFGAAFFLSYMLSPVVIAAVLPETDLRDAPEWMQSASVVGSVLPGALLIYWSLAKLARWTSSRIKN